MCLAKAILKLQVTQKERSQKGRYGSEKAFIKPKKVFVTISKSIKCNMSL